MQCGWRIEMEGVDGICYTQNTEYSDFLEYLGYIRNICSNQVKTERSAAENIS